MSSLSGVSSILILGMPEVLGIILLYFIERVDYLRVDAHNPTQGGLCNSQELTREGLCNQVVWGGCVGGLCNLICSREIKENTTTGARSAPVGRGRRPRLCFLYFP